MTSIKIFDTTLRDGEQVPGAKLNTLEKVEIAKQLDLLGVDVIEAGFAISSPEDLRAIQEISKTVKNSSICALSRAIDKDIDAAYEAVKDAVKPRIHTFISTSDIHLEHQIRKTRDEVRQMTREAVKRAKSYVDDVEFSAMDASRSDLEYLTEIIEIALEEGATTINIPDTVGYAIPEEWGAFIKKIYDRFPQFQDEIVLSVHVHDDLGLGTANSIAGILNGARQVECTVNGIGERAGNASMEEIVMALKTRYTDQFDTNINTREIYRTSRLVSQLMNMPVQPNKAVVGANAFAHASGIHQHGVLNERSTFEVMNPEDVGVDQSGIVLTSRSGKAALKMRLENLGYGVPEDELAQLYQRFITVADAKKEVYDEDLRLMMSEDHSLEAGKVQLELLQVLCGNDVIPMAVVRLMVDGEEKEISARGTGPVDAAFSAIDRLVVHQAQLEEYLVQAVTQGIDAQAKVGVAITANGKRYFGYGANTDIVVASAQAYVSAINQIFS